MIIKVVWMQSQCVYNAGTMLLSTMRMQSAYYRQELRKAVAFLIANLWIEFGAGPGKTTDK
jgi:hypothetical protein